MTRISGGSTAAATTVKTILGSGSIAVTFTDVGVIVYQTAIGRFFNDTVENNVKIPIPLAGNLKNASINVTLNADTATHANLLRVNGVSSTISISITALTTGVFSDTTHTVAVSALDFLNWLTPTSSTGVSQGTGFVMEFDPS